MNTQSVTIAGSIIAIIASILGLWWSLEAKIDDTIKQSTDLITQQIVRNAEQLAELHVADLEVRRRILKREIASFPPNKAPERMYIQLDALNSQIQDTKEKTW